MKIAEVVGRVQIKKRLYFFVMFGSSELTFKCGARSCKSYNTFSIGNNIFHYLLKFCLIIMAIGNYKLFLVKDI